MDQNKLKKRLKIIVIIIGVIFVIMYEASMYLMIINAYGGLKNACWFRYSKSSSDLLVSNVLTTSKTVNILGSGNYKTINVTSQNGATHVIPNPATYGEWVNAGLIRGEGFDLNISGELSLCKSYLPNYDLQTGSNTTAGSKIEIPRTEDNQFLALRFPSNANSWRNAFEIFGGDSINILVGEPLDSTNTTSISSVVMRDSITGNNTSPANCSTSVNSNLSPICGRFTPYVGTQYVSSCESYTNYVCPGSVDCCVCFGALGCDCSSYPSCSVTQSGTGPSTRCNTHRPGWRAGACSCDSAPPKAITSYRPVSSNAPLDYSTTSPSRTFSYSTILTDYIGDYNTETCSSVNSAATLSSYNTTISNRVAGYKFWLREGMGIVYDKVDVTSSAPPNITTTLTNYPALRSSGTIVKPDMGQSGIIAPGKIIYSESVSSQASPQLMRLAYINKSGSVAGNRGGYVLYLNHTKCKRKNGEFKTDVFTDRGKVLYYLVPEQYDLNQLRASEIDSGWPTGYLDFQSGSNTHFDVPQDAIMKYGGTLNMWVKINNKTEDYKDAKGQYALKFQTKEKVGLFTAKILMPIFSKVDNVIEQVGTSLFKNLTCYNQTNQSKCFNFFLYIKSLLTLYVMFFGFMFLMGKTKLNQKEFLIHVMKILIVGGLMNGSTFDFFNKYIFPMIMNFSDQVIANFGGYSNSAPFTFLDEALSRILLNELTLFQLLAIISFGLSGVVMFLFTLFGVMIFVMGALQSIATYILAKMMLAFLIGLAPLFLTFMLFSQTQQFFRKWVNNLFRYMFEPAVVILGLAVFSKLFTVYFDNVLGYSVCFKCAVPFMIPNILAYLLPGFPGIFADIYLFCLFWFGPWGIDTRLGLMGLSIPDIVGLVIMGYMCYTYPAMASGIVSSLTDVAGGFNAGEKGMQAANSMASFAASTAKTGFSASMKIGGFVKNRFSKKANIGEKGDALSENNKSKSLSNTPTGNAMQPGATDQGKMKYTENPMRQSPENKTATDKTGMAPKAPASAQEERNKKQLDAYKSKQAPSNKPAISSGAAAGSTGTGSPASAAASSDASKRAPARQTRGQRRSASNERAKSQADKAKGKTE